MALLATSDGWREAQRPLEQKPLLAIDGDSHIWR